MPGTEPLTLEQIHKSLAGGAEKTEARFAAIEKGLKDASGAIESLAAAVKSNTAAAAETPDPAPQAPATNVTTQADGTQTSMEPYPADLIASIMEAAMETDPDKRKASIKKAMGDHELKNKNKTSSFEQTDEYKSMKVMVDEYREAARRPVLDKLAAFYPGEQNKALVDSFQKMELAQLRTEVQKASAISQQYALAIGAPASDPTAATGGPHPAAGSDPQAGAPGAGMAPYPAQSPHAVPYEAPSGIQAGAQGTADDMEFVASMIEGAIPHAINTADAARDAVQGKTAAMTPLDVINATARGRAN